MICDSPNSVVKEDQSGINLVSERQCEAVEPSDDLKGLIYFVFNNLLPNSLINAVTEISNAVVVAHWPWVVEYMVHRACIETNLHLLYLDFLDSFVDSSLAALVLQETYKCISSVLQVDLSFDKSFDPTVLKNLGHWLGLQTIARGIPVSAPLWDIVFSAFDRDPQDLLLVLIRKLINCIMIE